MTGRRLAACALTVLTTVAPCRAGDAPDYASLREVPFTNVQVDNAFRAPRIAPIQERTIRDLLEVAAAHYRATGKWNFLDVVTAAWTR